MDYSDQFTASLEYARKFSMEHNINFIDVAMILIGILETDEDIRRIFTESTPPLLESMLKLALSNKSVPYVTGNIPLTREAEYVVRHSFRYVHNTASPQMESYHFILAVLSYKSVYAVELLKRGWNYATFLKEFNNKLGLAVNTRRFSNPIAPSRKTPPAWWAQLFPYQKVRISKQLTKELFFLHAFENYEGCILLCNIILDLDPKSEAAARYLFMSIYDSKNYDQVIALYKDCAAGYYQRMNLAVAYINTQKYNEAIAILEAVGKRTSLVYNNWGFCLGNMEKHEEAIPLYDKAIELEPVSFYPYNNKGYSLFRLGKIDEAISLINHSLSLYKGNSYAYRNLALLWIHEGNKEDALKTIELALLFNYREDFGNDIDAIIEAVNAMPDK